MERGAAGGVIAAKRAKPSEDVDAAGEDRFSALPDDVLIIILVHLRATDAAVRTSVLSRRWRRVWTLLPKLYFLLATDGHRIRKVLEVPEAPQIRRIYVTTDDAGPDSAAAWLAVAARRLSGRLFYHNMVPGNGEAAGGGRSCVRLPCFEKATRIGLNLGFLGLALPSSPAVFARLTKLYLSRIRFRGPSELGNVVSSLQCPCLQKLKVRDSLVLHNLFIHSESLIQIKLDRLRDLRQLTIVAPTLRRLRVKCSFLLNDDQSEPVANISAPQLVDLEWRDLYDPQSIHLGDLGQLQCLDAGCFLVYGQHDDRINHGVLKLLQRFQDLKSLKFFLLYDKVIDGFHEYLMEDITMLPQVKSLNLDVINEGHAFGASSFHLLKMFIGLRKLSLVLYTINNSEAQSACPSGCICDQQTNWKTEELSLNRLKDVVIIGLIGAEHEIRFVQRLFDWATALKNIKLVFNYQISESKVRQFQQRLSGFYRPETYVQCFMSRNERRHPPYLPVPQDQGTRV